MTYRIETSAAYGVGPGRVRVRFEYEPGDFTNVTALRVYHREGQQWVDRSAGRDDSRHVILAEASELGEFVLAMEPPAAAEFSLRALGLGAGGEFRMELRAAAGVYEIQYSTDLGSWNTLSAVTVSSEALALQDSTVNRPNSRFYRAVRVQ
jgi:hypothetical protein